MQIVHPANFFVANITLHNMYLSFDRVNSLVISSYCLVPCSCIQETCMPMCVWVDGSLALVIGPLVLKIHQSCQDRWMGGSKQSQSCSKSIIPPKNIVFLSSSEWPSANSSIIHPLSSRIFTFADTPFIKFIPMFTAQRVVEMAHGLSLPFDKGHFIIRKRRSRITHKVHQIKLVNCLQNLISQKNGCLNLTNGFLSCYICGPNML